MDTTPFLSTDIHDDHIPAIKKNLDFYNKDIEDKYPKLFKYGLSLQKDIAPILNTAAKLGHYDKMLCNCSLMPFCFLYQKPWHDVLDMIESKITDETKHFWKPVAVTPHDQFNSLEYCLPRLGFTYEFSDWYSMNPENTKESEFYSHMTNYSNGAKFIIFIASKEDFTRDNSHFIYAEKVNDTILFMDAQHNMADDMPVGLSVEQLDCACLNMHDLNLLRFCVIK